MPYMDNSDCCQKFRPSKNLSPLQIQSVMDKDFCFFIGDSIGFIYDEYLKKALQDTATNEQIYFSCHEALEHGNMQCANARYRYFYCRGQLDNQVQIDETFEFCNGWLVNYEISVSSEWDSILYAYYNLLELAQLEDTLVMYRNLYIHFGININQDSIRGVTWARYEYQPPWYESD